MKNIKKSIKTNVVIPTYDNSDMFKFTVGCGVFLQSYFKDFSVKLIYSDFDFVLDSNNNVVLNLNQLGVKCLKFCFDKYGKNEIEFIKMLEGGICDYLKKIKREYIQN